MGTVVDANRPDLGGNRRHGDINTFCPVTWRFFIERFAVRSVLDVGCGEGHAVAAFHRQGVFAHGIDGLRMNLDRAVIPIALHDLTRGPYTMPVDLVWSCEVAEHIDPSFVDNYIGTLCNGKIVAMTHALPGQEGHHHVNCQPAEYWIDLMRKRGYVLSRDMATFKEVAKKEECYTYFQRSGLVFVRND